VWSRWWSGVSVAETGVSVGGTGVRVGVAVGLLGAVVEVEPGCWHYNDIF